MMDSLTILTIFGAIKIVPKVSIKKIVHGDVMLAIHHVNGVIIIVDLVALNVLYQDLWINKMNMIQ